MNYRCPVCFFDRLPYPPEDYHICPCCGTEFENDDLEYTHDQLRNAWIANGAQWFYKQPPGGWDPWSQLVAGGRPDLVPERVSLYNYDSTWDFNESNSIRSSLSYKNEAPVAMIG